MAGLGKLRVKLPWVAGWGKIASELVGTAAPALLSKPPEPLQLKIVWGMTQKLRFCHNPNAKIREEVGREGKRIENNRR